MVLRYNRGVRSGSGGSPVTLTPEQEYAKAMRERYGNPYRSFVSPVVPKPVVDNSMITGFRSNYAPGSIQYQREKYEYDLRKQGRDAKGNKIVSTGIDFGSGGLPSIFRPDLRDLTPLERNRILTGFEAQSSEEARGGTTAPLLSDTERLLNASRRLREEARNTQQTPQTALSFSNLPSMSNINTQINSVLDSIANNKTNVGTGTPADVTAIDTVSVGDNPLLEASDIFQEEINNQQISTAPGTQVIAPTQVDTIAPYTGYSQYYSQDQAGQTTGNVGGSTLGGMTVNPYTGFMQSSSNYFGAPFTQQSYTPYQSPMGYQGSGAMNQFTSPAQTYTNTVTDPNAMPEYQRQMIMQNDYQNPTGSISFGQGPRLNKPLEGYNYTSYGNMNPVFNPAATSPTSSYVSPTTQESAQTATTGGTGFSGFGNFRG